MSPPASTAVVASKDDGSYQIVVPPGNGHLFVYGPTSDYILEAIGGRTISSGQPGGERYYAHAIIAYDVKAGEPPHEIIASLRPGKTVKGRLVGPDGQTVEHAAIISLLHFNYFHLNWRGDLTRHARDGSFELHGLDPEKPSRDLVPRRRAPVGRDGRALRQAGRRGRDDPPPALRPGQGPVRRPRRQASREVSPRNSSCWARPARTSGI